MGRRTVLWLGGMSGVGKTTAGRAVARRHDLWFYSLDSRTYAHAEAMNVPALELTPDELWVDRAPEQMADDFEQEARARFPLALEDLAAFPDDDAPILARRAPSYCLDSSGSPRSSWLRSRRFNASS